MTTEADRREEADLKAALSQAGASFLALSIVDGALSVCHECIEDAADIDAVLAGFGWDFVSVHTDPHYYPARTYARHAEAPDDAEEEPPDPSLRVYRGGVRDGADAERARIQALLSDRANTAAALVAKIRIATYSAVCFQDEGKTDRAAEAYAKIDALTAQIIDLFTI
jgi:phytoene dehydrogenase-like protein